VIRLPTQTSGEVRTQRPKAFLRYLLVGTFNTLLDLGLFTLFAVIIEIHPLAANILSTTITLCVSYLLNRVFVFQTERSIQRTAIQFVAVTLISGLVVQSAVIWAVLGLTPVLVPGLNAGVVATFAKIIAMGVGMISNYFGYRWLFGSR
jgi:putative flippase GtrA